MANEFKWFIIIRFLVKIYQPNGKKPTDKMFSFVFISNCQITFVLIRDSTIQIY